MKLRSDTQIIPPSCPCPNNGHHSLLLTDGAYLQLLDEFSPWASDSSAYFLGGHWPPPRDMYFCEPCKFYFSERCWSVRRFTRGAISKRDFDAIHPDPIYNTGRSWIDLWSFRSYMYTHVLPPSPCSECGASLHE